MLDVIDKYDIQGTLVAVREYFVYGITFCVGVMPIMDSGDTSLMKGNCEAWVKVAAMAVFLDPGGPYRSMLTRGVLEDVRTCSTNS